VLDSCVNLNLILVARLATMSYVVEDAGHVSNRRHESSTPRTPTTPTDAGHVSGEEDFFSLSFDCKVWMASGRSLGSFKCDETSSVGKIRQDVRKVLQDLHSKREVHFRCFALLRGDHTLL